MNIRFGKTVWIIFFIFLIIWILFFLSLRGIEKLTIDEFNKHQMIIAEQTAVEIRGYFENMSEELQYLSRIESLSGLNHGTRTIIDIYYKGKSDIVRSIARVDKKGRIVWVYPYERKYGGRDISSQPHISYLLHEHRVSLSDVFESVQGYKAIALHIPVMKNGKFDGSLGVLIDFECISKKFLDKIVIGEDGYAWLLNSHGTVLYSPVPGHTGKSIFEISSGYPELVVLANRMINGEKGTGSYVYNLIRERYVEHVVKQASFTPAVIMNTRWSIAVVTPEKQILSIMKGFRNEMMILALLLVMVNVALIYFAIKGNSLNDLIQKKKRNEDILAENETVLEVALTSAGKVAGGIAHDLNNVLAGIINSVEVLELKHRGDEKSEKYAGFIKDAALRGAVLVRKLANLSLVSSSAKASVDIHEVLEEALFIIEEKQKRRGLFKAEFSATRPIVKASQINLRKIIIRTAGGMAELVPEKGEVTVTTENLTRPDYNGGKFPGKTAITDTEYLKLSFRIHLSMAESNTADKFFLFLKENSEPDKKTDPGISDSYRRVKELGGDMIHEISGDFLTVSVLFPLQREDLNLKSSHEASATGDGGILIVEDEEAIKNALRRILTDLGYTVFTAGDGVTGIEIFRENHETIDLIILDIVMPVKGGLETLNEILKIDPGAIVFMTSGYVTGITMDELMSMGASGFIDKPVTASTLSDIISNAITGKKRKTDGAPPGI